MHAPLEDGELEGLVLGPELRKQPRLLVCCLLFPVGHDLYISMQPCHANDSASHTIKKEKSKH